MEITTIDVQERAHKGTKAVAKLREARRVPAVLYGEGKPNVLLSVHEDEIERHLRQHHKVFKLRMAGRERHIYLQDVQFDCLTDRPVHVDFKRIRMEEHIRLKVELAYIGHPVGLGRGGRLVKDMQELPVVSLPAAIPENIEVYVADMDLGAKIEAAQLDLPKGVSLDVPPDTVVCHIPEEVVRGTADLLAEGEQIEGEEPEGGAPGEDEPAAEGGEPES